MALLEEAKELPHYLRFDVFLSLFGILLVYFTITQQFASPLRFIPLAYFRSGLFLLGLTLILFGFKEMKENYQNDKSFQTAIRKTQLRQSGVNKK